MTCIDCGGPVSLPTSFRCRACWLADLPRQSRESLARRFWAKVDRSGGPDACWPFTSHLQDGYGTILVQRRQGRSNRVAYELGNGPIPDGLLVRHTCDNRRCCNPAHLIPGTIADNMRDAAERGRLAKEQPLRRGELNHNARLTADAVRAIRLAHSERQATPRELGTRYGVAEATAYDVIARRTWRHVA